MSSLGAVIASPWGSVIAIAAMTLVTFLCRIAGVVVMSRVRLTPRIERGLRALPGSIILATILPVVIDNGPPAIIALSAAIVAMAVTRIDIVGLLVGLGTLSIIRAFG
ncbi:AzlD family protein [Microvirga tunisiensis]|uniref:AzlD domain-containing protein n=1 Tax=Microvirga tunisiensis TaxID=2108360 RepID=A0A5N7MIU2_9HYPH|nr:AzlD domain-containing protein [Microvirga tunisiensis]MPR08771.1 AzlD domain-containing protein [Microvirga tunisiensis]MPR26981.1 AzlD domain-containing protein [Microvirga tunisiensis]